MGKPTVDTTREIECVAKGKLLMHTRLNKHWAAGALCPRLSDSINLSTRLPETVLKTGDNFSKIDFEEA